MNIGDRIAALEARVAAAEAQITALENLVTVPPKPARKSGTPAPIGAGSDAR